MCSPTNKEETKKILALHTPDGCSAIHCTVKWHTSMSESGMFASRTTDMGKQFLKFITSPLGEQK